MFQIKEMVDNPPNIGNGQHRHSAGYAAGRRLMVSRHRINVSRTSTLRGSEVTTGTPLCGPQLDVASFPLVRNQKRNIDATFQVSHWLAPGYGKCTRLRQLADGPTSKRCYQHDVFNIHCFDLESEMLVGTTSMAISPLIAIVNDIETTSSIKH